MGSTKAGSRRRQVEVVTSRDLSPTVRSITLELLGDESFAFEPGQYLDLFVPTQSGLVFKRPYSIASAPSAAVGPTRLEIAVTRVEGPTSAALHGLAKGTRLDVEGPRGSFVRRDPGDPALFVATGTGLAPLRAMIAAALREPSGPPMALVFGCRTQEDILWRAELEAWRREHARFRLDVTLSRPDAQWTGRRGYVQTHLAEVLADLREGGGSPRAYVCGVSTMVLDVVDVLERRCELERERIHYETYD